MTRSLCILGALIWFGGCAAPQTRQWLDSQTAVTITAQPEPVVLAREDFPAGVNVRDYAELGLFDVNRSGEHRRYVSLVLWSTVDRNVQELAAQDEAFSNVTLWANDQPLALKRTALDAQNLLVSTSVFRLPSPNARAAYYEISKSQLAALAAADHLWLTPAATAQGDNPYKLWRGVLSSIRTFVAALPD